MKIISVIPITKSPGKGELSYFTHKDITAGTIVSVPVRKSSVHALVTEVRNVAEAKSKIKSQSFDLKKVISIIAPELFTEHFMEAIKETARYFVTTPGSLLSMLTPTLLLKELASFEIPHDKTPPLTGATSSPLNQLVFQADDAERLSAWKSLIREEFARNRSLFLCVPTIEEAERFAPYLERGIEKYTVVLHSDLTKKNLRERLQRALQSDHPVLIIATGHFFGLPRRDIGTIIVEQEHSRAYHVIGKPHLDFRTFAEIFALRLRAKLILAGPHLRVQTIHRRNEGELHEFQKLKFRYAEPLKTHIVDMRAVKKKKAEKTDLDIFSPDADAIIHASAKAKRHTVVLVARRGLYPLTVCSDCGKMIVCPRCSAPMTLHGTGTKRRFDCHLCGTRSKAGSRCTNCRSWRLATLGIGTERSEKEIKTKFPKLPVFRLDSDTASTKKNAHAIIEEFYKTPGSVLIGTEMMLGYLREPVSASIVASLDALLGIPDYKIQERFLHILLALRFKTHAALLIQTRSDDTSIFKYALKGNLLEFYRHEIAERREFEYPPFQQFIKFTCTDTLETVRKNMKKTINILSEYKPEVFKAYIPIVKNKHVLHAVIKLPPGLWPNDKLYNELMSLPARVDIQVDPEDLL